MIGETASHYRVLERLGAGGMGDVYLAQDLRLHRPVALKMLKPEAHQDEAARARLLQEARAASALNHPNIAVIYEVDELPRAEGPLRFIAMEYVAGRTLAELTRDGPPTLDQVLDIVHQVAEALAEAHTRGIVHRDVKPSNVMVTESGRVKVLDFGLAKRELPPVDGDVTWSRGPRSAEGALVGTMAYMAPEQALGQDIDGRADVFSLGVLIYELLAGRLPFAGTNAVQVLDAILHKEPPPLAARIPDPRLPQVEAVLRRMLAKDRAQRYPGMRAASEALQQARRGTAAPPSPPAAPPSRAVAVLSFANITRNGEDDWLGTGIAETVTADLKCVEGLTVIARERVHEVRRRLGGPGEELDETRAAELGRALGARWVVSGGFQRAGEVVRVTARLTEVETGTIVQTVKLDGGLAAIFDLQDRIVRELSESLRMTLSPVRELDDTRVVEAYEAFSKGVINLRRESYESLDRAVFLFERAVALDPGYVRAHLELGSTYQNKAEYLAIPELHQQALRSFRRALELAPGHVRAWREMGSVLVALGREDEGTEAIQRALDLDPEDPGALASMARAFFVGRGQFREAVPWFEKALLRNPQGGWYALQLSHCYALLREFERGEAVARRAVGLQAAFLSGQQGVLIVGAHMRLGHLAALQGRHPEAVEEFRRELAFIQKVDHALRSRITIELHARLGASYQRLGSAAEADAAFAIALLGFEERIRLGADEPFTRYYVAGVYALRGAAEEAVACLERAARMRGPFTLARARIEPEFDGLRDHPRFRELVGPA
jgi:serine/threonine-protein kinase